jgi:hypothetical protein
MGSESRVATLAPTLDGVIRGSNETQIGQISQIGQRASNAHSRGVARAAGLKGHGLGTHWCPEAEPLVQRPWCDATGPRKGRSLPDLRDLPDLRPGSIGAPQVCDPWSDHDSDALMTAV